MNMKHRPGTHQPHYGRTAPRLQIRSYDAARAYLDGRPRRTLPGRATILEENPDGSISVYYHWTPVVTYRPNGTIELRSNGFETVTTKQRMNDYGPMGARVFQDDFTWYLWRPDDPDAAPIPYYDGILIDPDGTIA